MQNPIQQLESLFKNRLQPPTNREIIEQSRHFPAFSNYRRPTRTATKK